MTLVIDKMDGRGLSNTGKDAEVDAILAVEGSLQIT